MNADNAAALEFLEMWRPGGPWVLVAIDGNRQERLAAATFTAKSAEPMGKWLDSFAGTRNIYFHVNPHAKGKSGKASREDIAALAWLHVDVDPRAGEDIDKERELALTALQNPPNGVPKPTVIIFSGGGYQGFWKLDEPIKLSGKPEAYEDAKLYNLKLEKVFRADDCHNIDRVMRLPGTINVPNAKKRRQGRKPELAKLVKFNGKLVYPIGDFEKASPKATATGTGSAVKDAFIDDAKIKRLDGVDDLGTKVGDFFKVVIVQGYHPDDRLKYPSRSEALFAVCCELVRAGCDTELIYNVITDPDFAISKSVRDKGKKAERYARRQIGRAQEEAINPWLRKLNEQHAVIASMGGRCKVIEEMYDPALRRSRLIPQSFEDFRNRYMAERVRVGEDKDGKDVYMQAGKWWLLQRQRRQYDTIVFAPGQDLDSAYNLWRGFAVESKPGDCALYWDHVFKNICSSNQEIFNYVCNWMARAIQKPDRPGQSAIVMRGLPGTGKGVFAKGFGSLLGRHFLQVTDPKHLVGSFNDHLRDCIVLFGDEAFYAGDKTHEQILKALITEELVTIDEKYMSLSPALNCTHIILASNSDWVVPVGADDRRYLVIDVGTARRLDHEYFRAIDDQLDNGGREALLYELSNLDISNFQVRNIPQTSALQEQKLMSMSSEEEWWYDKLYTGHLLGDIDHDWTTRVRRDVLVSHYMTYAQRLGASRRANATALGRFLRKACPPGWPRSAQGTEVIEDAFGETKKHRPYYWAFPDIDKCREHWDKKFGGPFKWSTPEDAGEIAGELEEAF